MRYRHTASFVTLLVRAFRLRCVLCGSSGVFRGVRMVERCPRCRLHFEREQGQFIGAVGINTIVSFLALLVTIVVGFILSWPEPDAMPILIPAVAVAVVVPAAFFPVSKGVWGAIDLVSEPLAEDECLPGPWRRETPVQSA